VQRRSIWLSLFKIKAHNTPTAKAHTDNAVRIAAKQVDMRRYSSPLTILRHDIMFFSIRPPLVQIKDACRANLGVVGRAMHAPHRARCGWRREDNVKGGRESRGDGFLAEEHNLVHIWGREVLLETD